MFIFCSYVFGMKCVCLEFGYYEIFNVDYVYLVDFKKMLFVEIIFIGVCILEIEYFFDVIVYVIGYDVMMGVLCCIDI